MPNSLTSFIGNFQYYLVVNIKDKIGNTRYVFKIKILQLHLFEDNVGKNLVDTSGRGC